MRTRFILASLVALPLVVAGSACSDTLTSIGPFDGDVGDPLNYPFTLIAASIDLFGGVGRLHSFNDQSTSIHLIISSQFAGDPVTAHTGSRIIGFTTGPGIFEFDVPIGRFGAWWNNNSGANGAMVEFFDASGEPIVTTMATAPAPGNVWTWNGWESDVPIGSIRVTGFGTLDGFLWFDDLEMSYPAAACVGDLTGDGAVDGDDLGALLSAWGPSTAGDLNGDGVTDGADLAAMMGEWGGCA